MLKVPVSRPGRVLKDMMARGIVVMPGVFNPISALSATNAGSQGLYLSGAGISNAQFGVPDVGLVGLSEFAEQARRITSVVSVPVISDVDTGFGEAWNVMRTVIEMEGSGVAGIHLEDQVIPKRCGHLDGKTLVGALEMVTKLKAAIHSRKDPDFLLIARTDARGVEGLEKAIDRARAYEGCGADMIFPEGLESESEFERFRSAISIPMLANMTEFGKTPLISVSKFADLGYQIVIFPMTAFRVMLKAMDETYLEVIKEGSQKNIMNKMRTREELYKLIDYSEYENLDKKWGGKP